MAAIRTAPSWNRTALLVPLLLLATGAQASLVTPVGVRLVAPGGNVVDVTPTPVDVSATLATAGSVLDPDGVLSPNLLPLERIALDAPANSILLTVQQGDESGGTGWLSSGADRARYVFSGLKLSDGAIGSFVLSGCDGYAASCGGASGATSGVAAELLDLDGIAGFDALAFYLDNIKFLDRGADMDNFADFRITFAKRDGGGGGDGGDGGNGGDVPEPGTAALAALALGGLAALRRRRAAGA